jgi:16S rRNA (uracil1498-N3)-methyltransferase
MWSRVTALELVLILGVPREQKMDLVVQKATELGVARILPVRADHAVMQVRSDNEDSKRERWNRIALNAAKQCGAAWLPEIAPAEDLETCLTTLPGPAALLLCSLDPDALPLRSTLQSIRVAAPRAVAVLVGPEGDFSARERAVARNAGARPVSLGPRTLRSETAALYALSVLTYEFGL